MSGTFVQNRSVDGLDSRKAPIAIAKRIREATLSSTDDDDVQLDDAQKSARVKRLIGGPKRRQLAGTFRRGRLKAE
jgi:hypothetical protein